MEQFIPVLQMLLYMAAIVLLVVLIILGIKAIKVMDKADKVIDDVDSKMQSLNGFFDTIDKVGLGIDSFTNSVITKVSSILSIFSKNKKKIKKKEDDIDE
ncbi:MAG: hypothetical protein IKO49_03245 [Bacilli bacterium]|nr:hypothetical protein [Bacilli bacterium]